MLQLERTHDFQVFLSPCNEISSVNPPSFNWPQGEYGSAYNIELEDNDGEQTWDWKSVQSPLQPTFQLPQGSYRWRVTCLNTLAKSDWIVFEITTESENYLAPDAMSLFSLCANKDQFMMYLDEDIDAVSNTSLSARDKLRNSVELTDIDDILYSNHYRRGNEEGKRTAIANVRRWIDRDLIALTLLYKVWGDEVAGHKACQILLRLSEWSPEGPASLLRPCTWGDEIGLSMTRNLYLAYHWLSPLLTTDECSFVRPLLIRYAYQMEERLEQDKFKQYPGHSHTSRLPAYLGVAALVLHKEFEIKTCERWLNYALMIYRGVLPFYGGKDGSWVEGPFYSSSYTKWHHPFFLSVERLSGFSFYNHPFYKNYVKFALDFVANNDRIHPFGDGFWCKREGKEWPGFFAQNPLRIYAPRYGCTKSILESKKLESNIETYKLHLLDIVPTYPQLQFEKSDQHSTVSNTLMTSNEAFVSDETALCVSPASNNIYYSYAGLGKTAHSKMSVYYRASKFGNSSHRHADQGNVALVDDGVNVLTPSGSYGYRFGSKHHSLWTRTTQAHNLPLFGGVNLDDSVTNATEGQKIDCATAQATVITRIDSNEFQCVVLDLANAYESCESFVRTIIQVADNGVVIVDNIRLSEPKSMQWRAHTPLEVVIKGGSVDLHHEQETYYLGMMSDPSCVVKLTSEIDDGDGFKGNVESDAQKDIKHLEWFIEEQQQHQVVMSCLKQPIDYVLTDENTLILAHAGQSFKLNVETGEEITP
ncbi:heparinase II/III family protein [Vibrio cyclitrophicus]|uniref:heparinase II/III domain-containing protein n=1 Tax=Vibrio cyclitrophicus TaxID=47951 RepID=UPI0007EEAE19|nr:heparinase II/III family protein [Vibrio cyclitrophicus]MCC4774141.1 heparinase II/III-family protein [Vibrio cyclitrophicus]MCC4840697.1 heparinase II/III-family protein [Vibrio cyclitrophicus]OBS94673.1 heparinase [Vibrio cyclitrophicus]PME09278.1 heparinase [Vibrio cyclitrophicus]PME39926.1 heparinase [Vibrio cyclitrophicus]